MGQEVINMFETRVPPSAEVSAHEQRVRKLFDEAVVIVKTINSWPNHDVPDQNLYQSLKSRLYSIASALGYDVGNPDSRKYFHNTLWKYQYEGVLDYQISSPAEEATNLSSQETDITEEAYALLNNALQTVKSLDYNE